MADYFDGWVENIRNMRSLEIDQPLSTVGVCDRHLGPRKEVAEVGVTFSPSAKLELVNVLPMNDDLKALNFPDVVYHGLFDIILTMDSYPLKNIKISLTSLKIDHINATSNALRQAGRDAGRKLFAALANSAMNSNALPKF